MAEPTLQEHLDALVAAIGRAATVEDTDGHALAHGVHREPVDQVRVQLILTRETPPEVFAWQQAHGIASATEPVRIPPNPELGMLARLCVPLRHRGVRLGHLWIIEGDDACTAGEVALAVQHARTIAAVLYRDRSPGRAAWVEGSRLLARALGGDARARDRALRRLGEQLAFSDRMALHLLVAAPLAGAAQDGPAVALSQLQVAVADCLAGRPREHLAATIGEHVAVLAVGPPGDVPQQLAATVHEHAVAALGPHTPLVLGISEAHRALSALPAAHGQARLAAQVAAVEPALAPIAAWTGLGVYRLLSAAAPHEGSAPPPVPGLQRLGERADGPALLETLETYLDLAGNAQRTADALHLHRTSLYHRLGRIEEIAGMDLADGGVRLELHTALKLARLAGAPAL